MVSFEHERRYALADESYPVIRDGLPWSAPTTVTDVTMGPNGRHSMATVGWVLRLRTTDRVSRLELKGKTGCDKTFLEAGFDISDIVEAAKLLSLMGLRLGVTIRRIRRTLDSGGLRLSLDDVFMLGKFIEIESTSADFGQTLEALPKLLRQRIRPEAERGAYGDLITSRMRSDPAWLEEYQTATATYLTQCGLGFLVEGGVR